jgi:hypothetical protein
MLSAIQQLQKSIIANGVDPTKLVDDDNKAEQPVESVAEPTTEQTVEPVVEQAAEPVTESTTNNQLGEQPIVEQKEQPVEKDPFDRSKTYYKLTTKDEIHHDHQYKEGLNKLNKPFEREGECVPGGLYFVDKENLHILYDYGRSNFEWIREVIIPEDAQVVVGGEGKYRADKIIINKRTKLWCVDTLVKGLLNPYYGNINNDPLDNIIDNLEDGSELIKLIDWIRSNLEDYEQDPYINRKLFECALYLDSLEVMQRLKDNPIDVIFDIKQAVMSACFKNSLKTLDWLKQNYPTRLKCTEDIINDASISNNIEMLQWWKDSGLELRYTEMALDKCTDPNTLKWWIGSGLDMKYTKEVIKQTTNVDLLQCWKDSGMEL